MYDLQEVPNCWAKISESNVEHHEHCRLSCCSLVTHLSHSFINIKIQVSANVEGNTVIASSGFFDCDEGYFHRVTLLS